MKVHYINILFFVYALNILMHNQRNHCITTYTHTNRSLCECELYEPANYDNDPQMKEVMQQFEDRTSQRLRDYDERMKTTRQKCKDRCDKEIQKIILKDKLEKELMDKFATLHTDIQSDAIPTCVCEKSMADKVEKGCLRCGGVLGGGVAPGVGILGGMGIHALNAWKPKAIADAIAEAIKLNTEKIAADAAVKGAEAGAAKVVELVEAIFNITTVRGKALKTVFTTKNYTVTPTIIQSVHSEFSTTCIGSGDNADSLLCAFGYRTGVSKVDSNFALKSIGASANNIVTQAEGAAAEASKGASEIATNAIKARETALIEGGFNSTITSINAAIIAIVIIILIMVIIYLILRRRRKKKMKKKLQYIKLLEE
ncbi:PIR protein [Plasmodium sp. DRC-Itaito]|nr:PIR protein [Plasmodium sp. DRC-Itaito]